MVQLLDFSLDMIYTASIDKGSFNSNFFSLLMAPFSGTLMKGYSFCTFIHFKKNSLAFSIIHGSPIYSSLIHYFCLKEKSLMILNNIIYLPRQPGDVLPPVLSLVGRGGAYVRDIQ
mgnify:CR=1 FL=1